MTETLTPTLPLPSPDANPSVSPIADMTGQPAQYIATMPTINNPIVQPAQDITRPRGILYGFQCQQYETLARANHLVKTAFRICSDATFWVPASVQPNPRNDQTDPRTAERDAILMDLIQTQFDAFQTLYAPFVDSLKACYRSGWVCGFSVAEKIWEQRQGEWALVGLKQKPPWDFNPYIDVYGDLQSIYHYRTGQWIAPERLVYMPWPGLINENYLGVSEIEAARIILELHDKGRQALMRYIHKAALAPLIAVLSSALSSSERGKYELAIKNLEAADVLVVPGVPNIEGQLVKGVDVIPFTDRASQPMIQALTQQVDQLAKEALRTMGIPDMLGVTNTSVGSYARSRTDFDVFMAVPEKAQRWIESFVNTQIIHYIVWYNYPMWIEEGYLPPIYKFDVLDEAAALVLSGKVIAEVTAGLLTIDEGREQLGYLVEETIDETADTVDSVTP